ncbi:MAG: hypothetical protein ACYC5Y_04350 [Symbiobacteriia bacterium]
MDRKTWLEERRQVGEQRMDTLFAPTYDESWGSNIDPDQRHYHPPIQDGRCLLPGHRWRILGIGTGP